MTTLLERPPPRRRSGSGDVFRRRVRRARPVRQPRPVRPPSSTEQAASYLSSATAMVSIVCLWIAGQLLVLGAISHDRAQHLLYGDFRAGLADGTAAVGPVTPVGDPVALLRIPRVGVEQVVVEGTASGDLLAGPGHLRNTVLPGQAGTSVVMGRGATYGGPFADLPDLAAGDPIVVTTGQGEVTFTVLGVRRAGDPLPQPLAAGRSRLTLVTAAGEGRLAALRPGEVVYVDAEAGSAFPAPAGLPAAVPDSEKAMATDRGALPLLTLCLALLLALTLGVVAARQRWSAVLVWVVASPLVIALSWVTTDVVMRLLPNLI